MAIIDQTREDTEETANASRPYNEKRLLAFPTDGKVYEWDEDTTAWVEIT